jgi:CDP-diacylglycerol---glycerol-3-phosphate 3-phosphatidyltransferase
MDLRDRLARIARASVGPLVRGLVKIGVTANTLTAIGLVTSLAAAWLIVERHWTLAGIVFAVGSVMDMLDGSVARLTGTASPVGAFLDSTADRIADGMVLAAIAWTMAQQGEELGLAASMVAMIASLLVPYTRARAEGLGIDSNTGGLMSRPERIVVLAVGIFLGPHDRVLAILLVVLATLTAVTVVQRVAHVCKALRLREHREG